MIKKYPQRLTRIIVFTVALSIAAFIIWQAYSSQTNKTLQTQPLIPVNNTWKTRLFRPTTMQQDTRGFPPAVLRELMLTEESQLLPMRCSEHFVRNWEAMFFLQDPRTTKFTKSLDHNSMLTFLSRTEKQLPSPLKDQKFLLGKVCEMENGNTFFEYHRGKQKQVFDDFLFLGKAIETYIIPADNTFAFSKAIELTDQASGPNYSCLPLQITNRNILYYSCTELHETDAVTWYYRIDIPQKTKVVLDKCTFTYTPSVNRTCTND